MAIIINPNGGFTVVYDDELAESYRDALDKTYPTGLDKLFDIPKIDRIDAIEFIAITMTQLKHCQDQKVYNTIRKILDKKTKDLSEDGNTDDLENLNQLSTAFAEFEKYRALKEYQHNFHIGLVSLKLGHDSVMRQNVLAYLAEPDLRDPNLSTEEKNDAIGEWLYYARNTDDKLHDQFKEFLTNDKADNSAKAMLLDEKNLSFYSSLVEYCSKDIRTIFDKLEIKNLKRNFLNHVLESSIPRKDEPSEEYRVRQKAVADFYITLGSFEREDFKELIVDSAVRNVNNVWGKEILFMCRDTYKKDIGKTGTFLTNCWDAVKATLTKTPEEKLDGTEFVTKLRQHHRL
jgi:hypothetical protein